MRFNLAIIIGCFLAAPAATQHTSYMQPGYQFFKSFPDGVKECAQYYEIPVCRLNEIIQNSYPDEPDVRKLMRCALINMNCWNDTTGVEEHVMSSFFNPLPGDSCSAKRTRDCVKDSQLKYNGSDCATQAYNVFQCYYRQYGNLNQSRQFLPLQPKETGQLTLNAVNTVNISYCDLLQYSQGNIGSDPNFPQVLLNLYQQGGYYNPSQGLVLSTLYNLYGNPEFLSPQMEQCVAAVKSSVPCDASDAEVLYAIFNNCLQDLVQVISQIQQETIGLLGIQPAPATTTEAPTTTTTACAGTIS